MKIGIYTNKDKDKNYSLTLKTADFLKSAGAQVFFSLKMADFDKKQYFEIEKNAVDVLLVFGGDGTILGIAGKAGEAGIPILGINLGGTGFLTEVENDSIEDACSLLLKGDYNIEERSMLETCRESAVYRALNDVVLSRDALDAAKKIVRFEICSDGIPVDVIESDGLIISTPTGSTAYSLSAGGPILSPRIAGTLITAICPHSLHFRPLLLCDSEVISVKVGSENRVNAAFDGNNKFTITKGQGISVTKSEIRPKFIRFSNRNFYFKLRNKLNKWSTTSI
jgi:NAD+ kinase